MAITSEAGTDDRPDATPKVPKNRVHFDLAPRSMDRLIVLKVKAAVACCAKVVKNTPRLFEDLIDESKSSKQSLSATNTAHCSRHRQ